MGMRSTSGAMSAKGNSRHSGSDVRSKSMSEFRNGPPRCWDFPGISWDKERVEGCLARFHRPCLSDKRNLACSSSRSLGFGSSDCSITIVLPTPVLCLDYLSVMFNWSIVYSPFDSSPCGDDSCLE